MPSTMTPTKYLNILNSSGLSTLVQGAYGELIDHQANDLVAIVDEAIQKLLTIQSNPNRTMTEIGVFEASKVAAVAAIDVIKKLGTTRRRKLDSDRQRALKDLPSSVPTWKQIAAQPNGLATLNRLQEIRTDLKELDPLEVEDAAQQAALNSDDEVILAIATAPSTSKLLSPDRLRVIVDTFNAHLHPTQYQTLQTVDEALSIFDSNITAAVQYVTEAAKTPLGMLEPIPASPDIRPTQR